MHTFGYRKLVFEGNNLSGAFDDPGQHRLSSVLIQILTVVLDIRLPVNLGVKRDHDKPPPDSVIRGANLGKMVGIKDQCMRGGERERILIFLLGKKVIG